MVSNVESALDSSQPSFALPRGQCDRLQTDPTANGSGHPHTCKAPLNRHTKNFHRTSQHRGHETKKSTFTPLGATAGSPTPATLYQANDHEQSYATAAGELKTERTSVERRQILSRRLCSATLDLLLVSTLLSNRQVPCQNSSNQAVILVR